MQRPRILNSRVGRAVLATAVATVVAVGVPSVAQAVSSTSCANVNLDDPHADGPIRVFAAGYPGVYCYNKGTGRFTSVSISQVYEVDGASSGVTVYFTDSSGYHQVYIGPEGDHFWPYSGPGVNVYGLA